MDQFDAAIKSIVTPTVLISACGLFHLAFCNRLAIIVARLRSFNKEANEIERELIKHRRTSIEYDTLAHRAELITEQIKKITYRAQIMRQVLLVLYTSILLLILTSLTLGLTPFIPALYWGDVFFLSASLIALFISILLAFIEVVHSLGPVAEESAEYPIFVSSL